MKIAPIIAVTATILSASCSREHINLPPSCKKQKVYFTGSINLSKSTEIRRGSQSWIFIYNHGEDPCKEPPLHDTPVKAISYENGVMHTTGSEFIYITPGCYDFYSLSLNNSSGNLPLFTSGISDSLENEQDYLWSKCCNITISSDKVINFLYRHTSANITITAKNIEHSKGDTTSISITLPNTNSRMTLSDGNITNHSGHRHSEKITLVRPLGQKNDISFLILPIEDIPGIPVTINGAEELTGFIPSPTGGFLGGYRYTYSLIKAPDTLLVQGCNIEEWHKEQTINIITSEK
jgi:hypothetical protein